ncbi:MAG: hypothetical protein ISN28_04860 [Ectothiorhodospiraceae bacterium AqS1]|nr:hypothetical protein [Ectothiorhodospiraceae bacterium AqS1]
MNYRTSGFIGGLLAFVGVPPPERPRPANVGHRPTIIDEIDDRIAWVRPDAMSWTQPVGCNYADRFDAGHPAKGAALPDEISHKVDDINHWRQCMAAGFDDHKYLTCSVWSFGKFEAEIAHNKGLVE